MLCGPLDEALRSLFSKVTHLGALVQHVLSDESNPGQVEELDAAIQAVGDAR